LQTTRQAKAIENITSGRAGSDFACCLADSYSSDVECSPPSDEGDETEELDDEDLEEEDDVILDINKDEDG